MENVVNFAWALSRDRGILNWHYHDVEADDTINNVKFFGHQFLTEVTFVSQIIISLLLVACTQNVTVIITKIL